MFIESNVASPCVGVCKLDPRGLVCIGCLRSVEDIKNWGWYSDEEKLKVLERISGNL